MSLGTDPSREAWHEAVTPMTSVVGYAGVLLDARGSPARRQSVVLEVAHRSVVLEVAHRDAVRLRRLIEESLPFPAARPREPSAVAR